MLVHASDFARATNGIYFFKRVSTNCLAGVKANKNVMWFSGNSGILQNKLLPSIILLNH